MNQPFTPSHLVTSLGRIAVDSDDSAEIKLQKSLLVSSSAMIILAGLLWGSVYIIFDEPLAGAFPIGYAFASLLSIIFYRLTRDYRRFRFTQLLLILAIPFLLQLALGGFINSSAAVLWSLLCPLGALMFGKRRHAIWWFMVFLGMVIMGGILQPETRMTNNLPGWLVLTFFVANISAISMIAFIMLYHFVSEKQKFLNLLEEQAVTDSLTGLYNRTLLSQTLENAIYQNDRTKTPMALIAIDLDHFKEINDTMGHDAGDTVLRDIATLLVKRIRRSDRTFRMGGEEFVIMLYDTNAEQGLQLAEELRNAIELHQFLPDHPVTASLGVAVLQPGETWNEWMKRSDDNLYRAKSSGRNQVAT